MNFKKLLKEKKAKVVIAVTGAVLAIVIFVVFFIVVLPLLSSQSKVKRSATQAQGGSTKPVVNDEKPAAGGGHPIEPTRPLSISGGKAPSQKSVEEKGEKEETSQSVKKPQEGNPEAISQTQGSTVQSPLPDLTTTGPSQKDYKTEFETALAKFNRDLDASEIPLLEEDLRKILEELKEPQQPLKEYLKKNYETKRDAALGAKVAGENDLNELNVLLKGLQTVNPSYREIIALEVQFAEKFVPLFLNPFKILESKVVLPEDANLAKEAKNAFPLARLFANLLPPTTTTKDVRDKFSHESFSHNTLLAFLEHKIPKLIEEATDATAEAKATNFIAIIRLLNLKSRFAFEGEESFDAIKKTITAPARSNFAFRVPPQPKTEEPKVELQKFDTLKVMTQKQLGKLQEQISQEQGAFDIKSAEYNICAYNLTLLQVFSCIDTKWDADIVKAWINTEFNTAGCPEFAKWLEHVYENHKNSADGRQMIERVLMMQESKGRVLGDSDEEAFVMEHIRMSMSALVFDFLNMSKTQSGVFKKEFFKFLGTGTVEDVKVLFSVISFRPNGRNLHMYSTYFTEMKTMPLKHEFSFSSTLLYLYQCQQEVQSLEVAVEFQTQLKSLNENDNLDDLYLLWTQCVSKSGRKLCSNTLDNYNDQHLAELQIDNLEVDYKNFKDGKPERTVIDKSKGMLGLLRAFEEYIDIREYFGKTNVTDLEAKAITVFGFPKMPTDSTSLNTDTHKKNPRVYEDLAKYLLHSEYLKEWKTLKSVMDFLSERDKAIEELLQKKDVVAALLPIIEECKEGKGCRIDTKSNEISCTSEELNLKLETLAKFTGKMETYCQDQIHEGIQLNDLDKFIEKLKDELAWFESNLVVKLKLTKN